MSYVVTGLPVGEFRHLFGLPEEALAARGIVRKLADAKPGYPCRITLADAEPGETLLLLNYESHKAPTPYRSAYAIYVRESARETARFDGALPPVMQNRPIALRIFDASGTLIGADMGMNGDLEGKVVSALNRQTAVYLHAHNAMHGCFAAEIRRG